MKLIGNKKIEILEKTQKLIELTTYLKYEFIGIDTIIDDVIKSIRPFYIFPEYIEKPIVVNLWGMTGTGKTTLIEKIVDFLDLRKSYIKYDMGKDSDLEFSKIFQKSLGDNLSHNTLIVLDEFQLGRTINEKNEEKHSSRYIWDLVDSGKINFGRNSFLKNIEIYITNIKNGINNGIVVDSNGYITEGEEYLEVPSIDNLTRLDFELGLKSKYTKIALNDTNRHEYGKLNLITHKRFIELVNSNPVYFNYDAGDENRALFFQKPLPEILKTLDECFNTSVQIIHSDYSKSLIFCLGNLDDIYYIP